MTSSDSEKLISEITSNGWALKIAQSPTQKWEVTGGLSYTFSSAECWHHWGITEDLAIALREVKEGLKILESEKLHNSPASPNNEPCP
jgi:hypothetical protein